MAQSVPIRLSLPPTFNNSIPWEQEKKIPGTTTENANVPSNDCHHISQQTRHKPGLPFPFSLHHPLSSWHPHQSNWFKTTPGLGEEYLAGRNLNYGQTELKYLQMLPVLFRDSLSFERQGQLEISCTTQGWPPAAQKHFLSLQHMTVISPSLTLASQFSALPISSRDSCLKTHPEAEQLDEQCFPLWADTGSAACGESWKPA